MSSTSEEAELDRTRSTREDTDGDSFRDESPPKKSDAVSGIGPVAGIADALRAGIQRAPNWGVSCGGGMVIEVPLLQLDDAGSKLSDDAARASVANECKSKTDLLVVLPPSPPPSAPHVV